MAGNMFLRRLHEKKKEVDGIGWVDPVILDENGEKAVITLHAK